jgi:hypothetical protein
MLARLILTLLALTATAAAQPATVATVADFEGALPDALVVERAHASPDPQAAVGNGSLRLAPTEAGKTSAIWLPVDGIDPAKVGGIAVHLRAKAAEAPVRIRLLARDARHRRIYQRQVKLENTDRWQAFELPLAQFRWAAILAGWQDTREIGLVVETKVDSVGIDEIRLLPAAAEKPVDQLRRLAFEGRDSRSAEADGVLVATDATKQIAEADLQRTLGHARRARALIHRTFGDAVRPVGPPSQPAVLIFADRPAMAGFWQRMGTQWLVDIEPPTAGGYTVQDIATSNWDAKVGPDRPVYLHEAVHALLAHDVRLFTHHEKHWWVHEAVANYVQLCVYPRSLDGNTLGNGFRDGVADDGFFQPLAKLLVRRGGDQNYAQLATVFAFLAEKHPDWLPVIGKTLAEDGTTADALKQCGSSFDQLQAEWLAWGRVRYEKPRDDHFVTPKEWQSESTTDGHR